MRATAGGRIPAVEVMYNSKLVSELIEKGDFSGVKEAMEKSLTEGSQTFEQDLARLINLGVITREEGLAYADSPTNLMWRLQNDAPTATRIVAKREEQDDQAVFTELTIDVRPEPATTAAASLRRF
jgi:twitching motility protein PilU